LTEGFVGIDLGTSAVKVLVQDAKGRALAKASRSYPTFSPKPGWSEQAPDEWWGATCEALREAVAASGARVRSVGLSGQLNGFVLADRDGQPICPAVIWLDLRGEVEARQIAAAADVERLTGNELNAICVLPKLAWFRHHRPMMLDRAARILLVKDWVLFRLTGEVATDPSDAASTGMAAPDGTSWVPRLLSLAAIPVSKLPAIKPSVSTGGRITSEAADATGLPAGTPVAVGAGDVTALAAGCGIVAPGRVAITLGTAGHVVAQQSRAGSAGGQGLWRIPHAIPGVTLLLGLIISGGLSLAWLRQALAAGRQAPEFGELERLAAEVPPGSRGVTFLPFLEGAATPHRRPDARGAFFGLSSSHGTGEMVRAVMEGVAFNAVECIEAIADVGVEVDDLRLAEGGAQSPLWCAILAEALGRSVTLLAERDTSAAGAALIGRAALEGALLREIADSSCVLLRQFDPPSDRSGITAALDIYRARSARLLT
jgi:xylulokinase